MIVEFRLKNFLSFKNEALFSMVASSDKLLDEHIIQSDKLKLLSSAVIYGPNASGKTNILKAIERMKFLLIHSINFLPFQEMPIVPFRLSETRQDQSLFEIIFIFEGIRYRYGFEASSKKVYKEWFFYAPKGKEAMLFERNLQEFSFGTHFKGVKEIEKMVRENALMLSVSAQFNNPISGKVIEYFYNRLNVISNIRDMERADFVNFTLESILGDEQYKQNAIEFLNKADIAIKDLQVEKRGSDYVVNTKHNKYNQDGKVIGESYFDLFKEESDGTIKLFGLWAPIYDALLNGKVLIIDEPDTNLHPI
ncbi:ATP-binding protein, partial [Dolichospermum sp. ST_sed3]|nr:ATP-binding protein [Dolichospermum sp. ST_sed3]